MLLAVVVLGGLFYYELEDQSVATLEQTESTQASLALPEDKIIKFVVDKVADAFRLVPQRCQSTSGD